MKTLLLSKKYNISLNCYRSIFYIASSTIQYRFRYCIYIYLYIYTHWTRLLSLIPNQILNIFVCLRQQTIPSNSRTTARRCRRVFPACITRFLSKYFLLSHINNVLEFLIRHTHTHHTHGECDF